MTGFDIAIIVFIVASGLFAFVRGFVKEVLSIIAWFGASVAALYAVPYLRPLALRFTPSEQLAGAAAAFVAFIVALVVLSLITAMIANRVKDSPAGGIDRTFGFVFGLARGALLACLVYAAMLVMMPALGATPLWWTNSRTRPLLAAGLAVLGQLAPRSTHSQEGARSVEQQLQDALHAFAVPKSEPQPQGGAPNYSPQDQRDLDRLFQQNQGSH
ncbi:MAG: CvpA family protein [Alphaproteobacteria bacterium]|nr:CvpA family protein [Alphaproteobacteria bacterium]